MSDLIIMASLLNDIQFSIMEYDSILGLLPLRFLLLVHHDSFTWLLLLLVHHTAVASPREFYTVPAARCWIIALLIGLPRNIFHGRCGFPCSPREVSGFHRRVQALPSTSGARCLFTRSQSPQRVSSALLFTAPEDLICKCRSKGYKGMLWAWPTHACMSIQAKEENWMS